MCLAKINYATQSTRQHVLFNYDNFCLIRILSRNILQKLVAYVYDNYRWPIKCPLRDFCECRSRFKEGGVISFVRKPAIS